MGSLKVQHEVQESLDDDELFNLFSEPNSKMTREHLAEHSTSSVCDATENSSVCDEQLTHTFSGVLSDSSGFSDVFMAASSQQCNDQLIDNALEATPINQNSFCFESELNSKKFRSSNESCCMKSNEELVVKLSLPTSYAFLQSLILSMEESCKEKTENTEDFDEKDIKQSDITNNNKDIINDLTNNRKSIDSYENDNKSMNTKDDTKETCNLTSYCEHKANSDNIKRENQERMFINEIKGCSNDSVNCYETNKSCLEQSNDNTMNISNMHNQFDTGFITANNKKIFVACDELEQAKLHFGLSSQHSQLFELSNEERESVAQNKNYVESGFVTGHNKAILIDENENKTKGILSSITNKTCNKIKNVMKERTGLSNETSICIKDVHNNTSDNKIESPLGKLNIHRSNYLSVLENTKFSKNHLIRRYNIPEKGHVSTKIKEESKMHEVYAAVVLHFKTMDPHWVFTQFKWTWLYFFAQSTPVKPEMDLGFVENFIDLMNLRLKHEHSVLKRIVEFDDPPSRFIVLGVIDYNQKTAELFDGFYSVHVEIDENIYSLLKRANCTLGSRLFVFGAERLLKEPQSIHQLNTVPLRLFYNSVKLCSNDFKLGPAKKVTFLNTINAVRSDGGFISCLVVEIKRIIETKYLVTVENYRNRVDDVEKECERIFDLAEQIGHKIEKEDVSICKYTKALVEDETGECLLTWWNPPELNAGEKYKLIYLKPVTNTMGLHVSTLRKSYYEKI